MIPRYVIGLMFATVPVYPQSTLPLLGVGSAGSLVAQNLSTTINSGISLNLNQTSAPSNGNTQVVCVNYHNTLTFTNITQTNVTWTTVISEIATGAAGAGNNKMAMAFGTVGASAGSQAIVHTTGTAGQISASIAEFRFTNAGLDGTGASSQGTSTSPTTGAYTTASSNDLVISCMAKDSNVVPSVLPSYTPLLNFTNTTVQGGFWGYNSLVPAGPQSSSWTIISAAWATIIAGIVP